MIYSNGDGNDNDGYYGTSLLAVAVMMIIKIIIVIMALQY